MTTALLAVIRDEESGEQATQTVRRDVDGHYKFDWVDAHRCGGDISATPGFSIPTEFEETESLPLRNDVALEFVKDRWKKTAAELTIYELGVEQAVEDDSIDIKGANDIVVEPTHSPFDCIDPEEDLRSPPRVNVSRALAALSGNERTLYRLWNPRYHPIKNQIMFQRLMEDELSNDSNRYTDDLYVTPVIVRT